jgi:putative ABC transport system permease protein
MISIALKMLLGNKAAFIGVIFGVFLATLLISQQSAIFLGLMSRSYRLITDVPAPDIWVVDPATETEDKLRPIPEGNLDLVRSTPGVKWATPFSLMMLPLVTHSGTFHVCQLLGIDDATLIGAPVHMLQGNIKDLRREGSVIVDVYSATDSLAREMPNGKKVPLTIGDSLEINGHHATVVGICRITRGFYPQPTLFTTFNQMDYFNPGVPNKLSFIGVKAMPGVDLDSLTKNISRHTDLDALTRSQFKSRIVNAFLRTGILINFGMSVALGFVLGFSIAGQIFYLMTLENLPYYALIKAMGGPRKMILQMIIAQALLVGLIGFTLGIAATLLWGLAVADTTLAFLFPWQLLLSTGIIILIICAGTAALSIRKVFRVDPKILMGN